MKQQSEGKGIKSRKNVSRETKNEKRTEKERGEEKEKLRSVSRETNKLKSVKQSAGWRITGRKMNKIVSRETIFKKIRVKKRDKMFHVKQISAKRAV